MRLPFLVVLSHLQLTLPSPMMVAEQELLPGPTITPIYLDGFVFVNDGDTLTIEAGTVIKGAPGTQADASALIVARGAYIVAEGTAEEPIIMTFEGDPLDGSIPYTTKGQWGGLILLGSAKLNSVPGESAIEGIPTSEARGLYGGDNDEDNSGVLKYISVRHGGTDIGAGNEINGLTFGGVGSGTRDRLYRSHLQCG